MTRRRPGRWRNLDLVPRRITAGLRVLPDFVIAGAQKGGTSSLHAYLSEHPQVLPARKKEVHFFDRHFVKGEAWYRASFPTRRQVEACRRNIGAPALTGEASPSYVFHPLAAARMAALLPAARIVLLLRDPVERAHSHWRMARSRGEDTLSFPDALDAEEARLAGEVERVVADPAYFSKPLKRWSYVARGRYDEQVARLLDAFPRDRVLVLAAESFFAAPRDVYARVLAVRGLPPCPLVDAPTLNRGAADDAMSDDVRARLTELFRPHNERLFALLGEHFDWRGGGAR